MSEPKTLDELNLRALALSTARNQLGTMVQQLNAALEALKANEMPAIRTAIDAATAAWAELEAGIQSNPGLFVRPRTVAAHGITFGIQKSKGVIKVPDEDKTVALIRKHMPERADVLIARKDVPVKKALEQLPAAELKRLGVQVTEGQDTVVIRPAPSDVDKLVKALVKAEVEAPEAANAD